MKKNLVLTISGVHGTGKSVVGKSIAKTLELKYYSTGDAFRDLTKKMNMTLEAFTLYVNDHPEIDNKLDNTILEIAKEGNVVIDSQLSGQLLKDIANFKILLTCPLETRVKRMSERDKTSYETKLKETLIREKSELERFKILYKIDLTRNEKATSIYDLIIDTGELTVEEVIEKIVTEINKL